MDVKELKIIDSFLSIVVFQGIYSRFDKFYLLFIIHHSFFRFKWISARFMGGADPNDLKGDPWVCNISKATQGKKK
ncbi:MAG: hypothetical protein ACTSUE_17830 [Promethearchaeota archaeon]